MATEWKSQQGEGKFALQFETDCQEKYRLVEKAAQLAMDGKTTADYAEVKHGEWIEVDSDVGWELVRCSLCGKEQSLFQDEEKPSYCPCCGAKINGNNLSTIPTGSEGRDT